MADLENWSHIGQMLSGGSAALTFLAIVAGGVIGLRRYRRHIRLRAAELLMGMEQEYRTILPTCIQLEYLDQRGNEILEMLKREAAGDLLCRHDVDLLFQLDRCLRFFYLCTVLHSDLQVEETAIARSYYYYVSIIAEEGARPELQSYVQRNYRRLHDWIARHRPCLVKYRESGMWDPSLAG